MYSVFNINLPSAPRGATVEIGMRKVDTSEKGRSGRWEYYWGMGGGEGSITAWLVPRHGGAMSRPIARSNTGGGEGR